MQIVRRRNAFCRPDHYMLARARAVPSATKCSAQKSPNFITIAYMAVSPSDVFRND